MANSKQLSLFAAFLFAPSVAAILEDAPIERLIGLFVGIVFGFHLGGRVGVGVSTAQFWRTIRAAGFWRTIRAAWGASIKISLAWACSRFCLRPVVAWSGYCRLALWFRLRVFGLLGTCVAWFLVGRFGSRSCRRLWSRFWGRLVKVVARGIGARLFLARFLVGNLCQRTRTA